jgi:hypothetical protein
MKRLAIPTLEKGYADQCEIMLHGAFALLVDFVEQEKLQQAVCWDYDEGHKKAWAEMVELYEWWKTPRSGEQECDDDVSGKTQEMFMRLAKIRQFLWT